MTAFAIETSRLGKRYRSRWALEECTFSVPEGKVCGLVGANGAGKSTLLRMLAGLSRPSAGGARIDGLAPDGSERFLRSIGYLAQDTPLYGRWTAADHLRMGEAMNPDWDPTGPLARLENLRIPLDRRVEDLSGGMRAQVALALVMGKQPSVLLLDEPVAALDPLARRELLASLAVAMAERPMTVLVSSHLLPDLERICDHLVILSEGRPALVGDVTDLVEHHRYVHLPESSLPTLHRDHEVISEERGNGHAVALTRITGPIIDPAWEVHDAGLEDVVLAYLRRQYVPPPPTTPLSAVEVIR